MSIRVPVDVEAHVQKLVNDGAFGNSDEAIREAVRLLEVSVKSRTLQQMIERAREQVERGEAVAWSDEMGEAVWHEAQNRQQRGEAPGPDVLP